MKYLRQYGGLLSSLLPVIAILLAVVLAGYVFFRFGSGPFIDLRSFYYGTRAAFLAGQSPYSPDFSLLPGSYAHPFIYWPASLLVLYPLQWFEYEQAGVALSIVSILTLPAGLYLLTRQKTNQASMRRHVFLGFLLLCFLSQTFRSNIYHGQINVVLLGLLCVALWALRRDAWWVGGLFLALAIALKMSPVLLLVGLVFATEMRRFKAPILCLAGLVALSLVVLSPQLWLEFIDSILFGTARAGSVARSIDPTIDANLSLFGLISRRIQDHTVARGLYLVAAGFLCVPALHAAARTKSVEHCFRLFLPLLLLLSPLSWEHHIVLLTLPALSILLECAERRQFAPGTVVAVLLLLLFTPIIPAAFLRYSVPTFSALGLFGVALQLSTYATRSPAVEHSSQQPDGVLESTYYA